MKYGGMNRGVINLNGRNSMIFTNTIHAQVEEGQNFVMSLASQPL
jgi:hypothetical protein